MFFCGEILTSVQKLVTNFGKIIETVLEDIDSMGSVGDSDLDKGVQSNICDGFRDVSDTIYHDMRKAYSVQFVKVHQALLSTVIGKAGILRGTPLTAAVAEILAQLEMGVDKLAFGIIDAVPTCADDAKKDLGALDKTIGEAKGKFSSK